MKIVATFLIVLVVGHAYSLAAKNSSTSAKAADEKLSAPKNSTSITKETGEKLSAPKTTTPSANDEEQVAPGITVSKGFKRANCLASRFAVLCASSSTVDGCVTKDSKKKCGKQCVCGTKECACGTSGCCKFVHKFVDTVKGNDYLRWD